eukprot:g3598.t1
MLGESLLPLGKEKENDDEVVEAGTKRRRAWTRLTGGETAVCLSGLAVEFNWAAGESVIIPHLLAAPISLHPSVAGLVFLIDPVLSVFFSTWLGSASDSCTCSWGRRRPFLLGLGILSVAGLAALVYSATLGGGTAVAILVFASFGLMDLAHDMILIPGRALLAEMRLARGIRSDGGDDDGHAENVYTLFQNCGRLVSLVACAIPVEHLLTTTGVRESHFQAMIGLGAVVMVVCIAIAVLCGKEEAHIDFPAEDRTNLEVVVRGDEADRAGMVESSGSSYLSSAFLTLLTIQFLGWISICLFAFWCTTWIGLDTKLKGTPFRLALVVMAAQTLTAICLSPCVPWLNRKLGTVWVWFFSEVAQQLSLVACRWLGKERPFATIATLALCGGAFQTVHITNIYMLAREVVQDDKSLGFLNSMANYTMVVAQILVGALAGLVTSCPAGGSNGCSDIGERLFFVCGSAALVLEACLLLLDAARSGIGASRALSNIRGHVENEETLTVKARDDTDAMATVFCVRWAIPDKECAIVREHLRKKQHDLTGHRHAQSAPNIRVGVNLHEEDLLVHVGGADDAHTVAAAICAERHVPLESCHKLAAHLEKAKGNTMAKSSGSREVSITLDGVKNVTFAWGSLGSFRADVVRFCGEHSILNEECVKMYEAQLGTAISVELEHIFGHQWRGPYQLSQDHRRVEDAEAVERIVEALFKERSQLLHQIVSWRNAFSEQYVSHRRMHFDLLRQLHVIRRERQEQEQEQRILPIPRYKHSDLTYGMYRSLAKEGKPFILTDMMTDYHGRSVGIPRWSLERIKSVCGGKRAKLKRMAGPHGNGSGWAWLRDDGEHLISTFIDSLRSGGELSGAYLHDVPLATVCPELLQDVVVPSFFARDLMQGTSSTLHHSWNGYRDYWPSLFVGSAQTASGLHADWCDTSAWMGLVQGKKHWRIVTASERALLYEDEVRVNNFETSLFDDVDKDAFPAVTSATVYDAVMMPGEVIYLPSGAPHQVMNVGGDTTIAIAMNFIDLENFKNVRLRMKENAHIGGRFDYLYMTRVIEELNDAWRRVQQDPTEPRDCTYTDFKEGVC